MTDFHDNLIRGGHIKELVKTLLEKSGYSVFPHGYESTYSQIKKWLSEPAAKSSPTARRLRSSPDIIVYDEQRRDVMLV